MRGEIGRRATSNMPLPERFWVRETIPEGLICGVCMQEQVQCYGCARSYQRKEYVTEKGLDRLCVDCQPEGR